MVDFVKRLKRAPRLDLNPSAADRWTTCTASPQFILDNWDRVPASDDTKFNREGTTAHEVAAAMLQDREPDIKDSYKCPVPVDGEMRLHAWNYWEYVRGLMEPGATLLVEQKLPLWYMPERNAIVDAAVINGDSLHVIDYKYGAGVVVSPVGSLQAAIYARALEKSLLKFNVFLRDDFPVTIHIYQPRGRAANDGAEHTWQTNWREIDGLGTWQISQAADYIQNKVTEYLNFAPSEKACQWCPAKGFCPARQQHFAKDIEALQVIPAGDKHLLPVKTVSVQQLANILKHKAAIEKWLSDAYTYALQYMSEGNTVPGYKLVLSRGGNRKWSDPKQAAKLLLEKTILRKNEVIEERVISPTEAEELLGKNKLSADLTRLVVRAAGWPTIAPEDDPRESLLLDGKTEFEPLEEIE